MMRNCVLFLCLCDVLSIGFMVVILMFGVVCGYVSVSVVFCVYNVVMCVLDVFWYMLLCV